jgi:hypothetical protein
MNTMTMTKQQQIITVHGTIAILEGTLMGDWLADNIAPAAEAIKSDYNPSVWAHGIDKWVDYKVDAACAAREAELDEREESLAAREAALAKGILDHNHWRDELFQTARSAHTELGIMIDHL